ncbi:MAG: prolyl aminopeptidase [Rhodospirillaceae bacterium]
MDRQNLPNEGFVADLYPRIEPFAQGMLDVSGGHRIYWEESGNPAGVPVVFLHGGPGAGTNPTHRRFFDPDYYRIILFDQRGSGRSKPFGEVRENSTQNLIADMEQVRQHLNIHQWLLFGGSWGSTLALAYGIAHPENSLGFILRGIFLGQASEIDWFLYGIKRIFPEAWQRFCDYIPAAEQGDLLAAYHKRLVDPDPAVHMPAAETWSRYESACSTLRHNDGGGSGRGALSLARLEAHYFVNGSFMENNHILDNLGRVSHLPATIVQGRYDIICPIETADKLRAAWPNARYVVVPDAGHSAMEPGIRSGLVAAADGFRSLT